MVIINSIPIWQLGMREEMGQVYRFLGLTGVP